MHEHGLADYVLDALLLHRDRVGAQRVLSATLQVSELGGVSRAAFQAALDHCCEHHQLEPIQLTLETPGIIAHCSHCDRLVPLTPEVRCADCGSADIRLCGDEAIIIKNCECV